MSGGFHFIEKCKHGVVRGQCRCPGPNKTVRRVPCGPECEGVVEKTPKYGVPYLPFMGEPPADDRQALRHLQAEAIRQAVTEMRRCRKVGWTYDDPEAPGDAGYSPDRWMEIYADRLEGSPLVPEMEPVAMARGFWISREDIDAIHREMAMVQEKGLTQESRHFARTWGGRVRSLFLKHGWRPRA